jgi:kynurenine formamidase
MSSPIAAAEVMRYFEELSNWGRWGSDDELGTLNLITEEKRQRAAQLVTNGLVVSCAWDIPDGFRTPEWPVERKMIYSGEAVVAGRPPPHPYCNDGRAAFTMERIGFAFHGFAFTHVDSLAHGFWNHKMYNGRSAREVTDADGATRLDATVMASGIVSRGVLLDVARAKDRKWLEPGEAVMPTDLEECENRDGFHVEAGDVLLLRTGVSRRRYEEGERWDPMAGSPGWHASCLPWFHERGVAAIASDVPQDVMPPYLDELSQPIHSIAMVAMGLVLIDNCDLEALSRASTTLARSVFQIVISPLRLCGVTGSPVNPLAIF